MTEPATTTPADAGRAGYLVLGVVLVGLGLAWLLDALDVIDVSLGFVLAVLLIGVGTAIVASRGHGTGWLIGVGIVVAVLAAFATAAEIGLGEGTGDRLERPVGAPEPEYSLGAGSLKLDLRHARLPAHIEASIGVGELAVTVPSDALVTASVDVGIGDAQVLEEHESGFGVEVEVGDEPADLELELAAGVGSVKVVRE